MGGADMLELPSGQKLKLSRKSLIRGRFYWCKCPPGHFLFLAPVTELTPPPYELTDKFFTAPKHAPVPRDREEAKQYVQVLQHLGDGRYLWRGEWLSTFPLYAELDDQDMAAWAAWLDHPDTQAYLDDTIKECQRLAEKAARVRGHEMPDGAGSD